MRTSVLASILACVATAAAPAGLITSVPGPDDQGGMIMPEVFIADADDFYNPTRGALRVSFAPHAVPVLADLQYWWSGSWFAATAAWRGDLGSPAGEGGTPPANAGRGDLFNCQYGFTFTANPAMGAAYVPYGKCLAIRLKAISSPLLRAFNYDDYDNIWDEVMSPVRPQVLWDGTMWHNYFTLPATAAPGTYTAVYEVFIADAEFQYGTGFVDYSPSALVAVADPNFSPATVAYTWSVEGQPEDMQATIRFDAGTPVISVRSITGAAYRLQTCDGVPGPAWTDLGDAKPGNGGVLELTDPTVPLPPRRFYRLVETR